MPSVLKNVTLGLGWTTRLDLDASVIMVDKRGVMVDCVYFGKKISKDGGIVHSGDNTTG